MYEYDPVGAVPSQSHSTPILRDGVRHELHQKPRDLGLCLGFVPC